MTTPLKKALEKSQNRIAQIDAEIVRLQKERSGHVEAVEAIQPAIKTPAKKEAK